MIFDWNTEKPVYFIDEHVETACFDKNVKAYDIFDSVKFTLEMRRVQRNTPFDPY